MATQYLYTPGSDAAAYSEALVRASITVWRPAPPEVFRCPMMKSEGIIKAVCVHIQEQYLISLYGS
jgi:hypothetical protein